MTTVVAGSVTVSDVVCVVPGRVSVTATEPVASLEFEPPPLSSAKPSPTPATSARTMPRAQSTHGGTPPPEDAGGGGGATTVSVTSRVATRGP